ncbi:MAG: TRAP transporter small permease subunit [Burkholderiales bacterium]|nr:TRAP transporter small permease subunit [Burkholderiales bacterium]
MLLRHPVAQGYCGAIDRLNEWMGLFWGYTILLVTFAVLYEVVARSLFNLPTTWSNESVIYVSAVAYLLSGGYALLYHRHVRIDLVHERFSPKARARLDLVTFVFFLLYVGTLTWVGGQMAWDSFSQSETTGTPWNPLIWPVKLAIPLAGLLLLLQGVANLLREIGLVEKKL